MYIILSLINKSILLNVGVVARKLNRKSRAFLRKSSLLCAD